MSEESKAVKGGANQMNEGSASACANSSDGSSGHGEAGADTPAVHPAQPPPDSPLIPILELQTQADDRAAAKARVAYKDGIHKAVERGDIALVQDYLIADPSRVNKPGAFHPKSTPLHCAARCGHVEVVQLLLSCNAAVDARNSINFTPLHDAACWGRVDVVQLLLSCNADVDARTSTGDTPIHRAASDGRVEVVQLLLSCNAAVDARNSINFTPLHDAVRHGHVDVVQLLLSCNADVDARTSTDKTPLHCAAEYNRVDVCRALISAKANAAATDNRGNTPLTWVIEDDRPDMNGRHKDTQHGDVIAFLRSVGAPE